MGESVASDVKVLDLDTKYDVQYAIPPQLRDEQIKLSVARVHARIPERDPQDVRRDPVAVVCYGPSLNDTWEKIREFKYVITCSGAHSFLIKRGIVPSWHVAVDPLPRNTVELIGPPYPGVEYLIGSPCHPDVFDHLEGYDVKLWHVFDSEADAVRVLPYGEWAFLGGPNVGLRALTLARFLGFTDLHVFGMDACEGVSGRHAAEHPSRLAGYSVLVYDGVTYRTNPAMLECAKNTWDVLNQMPGVHATFYGDGLVQHMAKYYVPKPVEDSKTVIAVLKEELISPVLRDLNRQLHRTNPAYGAGGARHVEVVLKLIEQLKQAQLKQPTVLDYGCGKGHLGKALPFPIWEYDPAITGQEEAPRPADLVVCTDVLEHVEPEKLLPVLGDLSRCIKQVAYFNIHTGPAAKCYADGRNTHLLQRDAEWWRDILGRFFTIYTMVASGSQLFVIAAARRVVFAVQLTRRAVFSIAAEGAVIPRESITKPLSEQKILCVCKGGVVRSTMVAYILKFKYHVDAVAIGIEHNSPATVAMLCEWADQILVVDEWLRAHIRLDYHGKLTVLNVGPDRWGVPHPELKALCKKLLAELVQEAPA